MAFCVDLIDNGFPLTVEDSRTKSGTQFGAFV
jgi:hypothetical protein